MSPEEVIQHLFKILPPEVMVPLADSIGVKLIEMIIDSVTNPEMSPRSFDGMPCPCGRGVLHHTEFVVDSDSATITELGQCDGCSERKVINGLVFWGSVKGKAKGLLEVPDFVSFLEREYFQYDP